MTIDQLVNWEFAIISKPILQLDPQPPNVTLDQINYSGVGEDYLPNNKLMLVLVRSLGGFDKQLNFKQK